MSALIPRTALRAAAPRIAVRQTLSRRTLGTVPPAHRPRSWKSSAARWGLAIGGVWFLSSSNVLAEGPTYSKPVPERTLEDENLPTVDTVAAARRERQALAAQKADAAITPPATLATNEGASAAERLEASGDAQQLEEEAEGEGAFNPETGEINWDCPCLGGMAHGPCGPEFREAFSCFVYSNDEPKGINCVEKFKHMQDCFRAHPDVYGAELTDDPSDEELEGAASAAPDSGTDSASAATPRDAAASANEKTTKPEKKSTQAQGGAPTKTRKDKQANATQGEAPS